MGSGLVQSEADGIEALRPTDARIYSAGISSFLNAEIAMAAKNPAAQIIATTVDEKGLEDAAEKLCAERAKTISCRLEDVSKPLPYPGGSFDFVYARLVLHYLDKNAIASALAELYRVLRDGGRMYVVVRSLAEEELLQEGVTYDESTGFHTYPVVDCTTGKRMSRMRRFYSDALLKETVESAGFCVIWCKEFSETLYKDFQRTLAGERPAKLISLLAEKGPQAK